MQSHANRFRAEFKSKTGEMLAARIDRPAGKPRAWALFAHCFTCGKDLPSAQVIAQTLAAEGIAVLRFDFTGLGGSSGDFASTNFSSNGEDLIAAANWLRDNEAAPALLIGHSLGGAAALAVAQDMPELRAIATIGAPADPAHIRHLLREHIEAIQSQGEVRIQLAGRPFTVRKQLLEDISSARLQPKLQALRKALLILHSPTDDVVGIDNAGELFGWAKHPKSFLTLDWADHLLSRREDAAYAAQAIAAWANRYVEPFSAEPESEAWARVMETGRGQFQQSIALGRHHLIADEPTEMGGLDSGPSPYQLLLAGLGACSAMTVRLYAKRKNLPLDRVSVDLKHSRAHQADSANSAAGESRPMLERIERVVHLAGDLTEAERARLLEIAERCPVHRTLSEPVQIDTRLADRED
ncbi:MAG: bifunctional alpha/beta hydrolase/OsmC family protein [Pseudomonadota bacterium]|nr:bifunctional alpha/beta hydrolase/OsmC family protein [Pseudomonadota bacterium]